MLNELKIHHRKICQLSFEGYDNTEIAEKLSLSNATVSAVLRSPLGKAYVNGLMDKVEQTTLDVRQKLVQMNEKALNAIDKILSPESKAPHAVILNAAKDNLDRTGYKVTDKIDLNGTLSVKSDAEIDAEIAAMEAEIARTYKSDITKKDDESEDSEVIES